MLPQNSILHVRKFHISRITPTYPTAEGRDWVYVISAERLSREGKTRGAMFVGDGNVTVTLQFCERVTSSTMSVYRGWKCKDPFVC